MHSYRIATLGSLHPPHVREEVQRRDLVTLYEYTALTDNRNGLNTLTLTPPTYTWTTVHGQPVESA
jgi:hypothetical protein